MDWKRWQNYIPRFRFLNKIFEAEARLDAHRINVKHSRITAASIALGSVLLLNLGFENYLSAVDKYGPVACRRSSTAYAEKIAPSVERFLESHYGIEIEDVEFDRNPPKEILEDAYKRGIGAGFSPMTDKITLYFGTKTQHLSFGLFGLNDDLVRQVTAHEIAHDYIKESLDKNNIDWILDDPEHEKVIIRYLLEEGIGSHFEVLFGRNPVWPKGKVFYPKTREDLKNYSMKDVYPTGYHLVKPILDAYPKKGLEYIIRNPPHSSEIFELKEWQEETLDYLENQSH